VQAAYGKPQQSVVTMPLLVGTDGKRKMSKSYDNYIAVNDPPEEMFGKLMSVPDDAMGDYYLLLLDEELDPSRAPNEAKRELARRLTDRFHGQGAGAEAEARFDQIHVRGELPDEIPLARVEATNDGTVHLPALIAREFELSTSEARRLIGQGGVRLDGEPLGAETLDVPAARLDGRVLQVGKRRFRRLAL
jgi:tyrosyl-tRNA synthetase